jgi:hypothetical protein
VGFRRSQFHHLSGKFLLSNSWQNAAANGKFIMVCSCAAAKLHLSWCAFLLPTFGARGTNSTLPVVLALASLARRRRSCCFFFAWADILFCHLACFLWSGAIFLALICDSLSRSNTNFLKRFESSFNLNDVPREAQMFRLRNKFVGREV